ncbi:uncharacterized protein LOC108627769 [Ceratina calcarata]|uniref:Uncharacterized protein LOC108627769 n=1 Tax=Ceratina calcarata TaxID=156304 RepID=A0AAJ7WD97_9HYME|nr:uncharacterized protein LOC108627769 [Ceratina calcarata]
MQSIPKLIFVTILCVALWMRAKADNKITVNSFDVDIPGNDIVGAWDHDLANNLISSTISIKRDCPGVFELDIKVYEGEAQVQQMNQKLKKPIKDIENYNLCASIDGPDPEDDQCSILEGEQSVKDCDVRDWFKDMSAGDYKVVATFSQDDQNVATITMNVLVENDG